MDEDEISETLVAINTTNPLDSFSVGMLERLRVVNQLMQQDAGQGRGARILYTLNGQPGVQILGERFTAGRSVTCNLRIDDSQLSREHFEIVRAEHLVTIRDLDSKNGIRVNDEPTREKNLIPGDVISAGKTLFIYLEE